ncbi:Dual specificity protein phosphatase 10 [Chionoecetes opilio]|uniref:protein-tyrosine-phosphatase n=1 Tax=Chionoecetes opilio TaxID=41210 RepID=A0A8J8WA53_CHIOP|nr:Dual specificity protein phosphatase 10 [Chionoecetes opilio]
MGESIYESLSLGQLAGQCSPPPRTQLSSLKGPPLHHKAESPRDPQTNSRSHFHLLPLLDCSALVGEVTKKLTLATPPAPPSHLDEKCSSPGSQSPPSGWLLIADEARQSGARVLVHCQAGVSRSPTIVIAYLMKHTRMTMVDSYKYVKARRIIISPNLNFMGQLVEWETALQANKTEADCKPCHQCQWQRQEAKKVPNACHV